MFILSNILLCPQKAFVRHNVLGLLLSWLKVFRLVSFILSPAGLEQFSFAPEKTKELKLAQTVQVKSTDLDKLPSFQTPGTRLPSASQV